MQTLETLVSRLWWTLVLRGVVAILFGVLTLVWPGVTLGAVALLFGFYAFADGAASIAVGMREFGAHERWWPSVIGGLVSIAAGLVAILMPGITMVVVLTLIGAWAVLRGAFDILAAIRLRKEIDGEWLLALSGAVSVVFGILLFVYPVMGALVVTWWIGLYACFVGIVLVWCGFRLKSLARPALA